MSPHLTRRLFCSVAFAIGIAATSAAFAHAQTGALNSIKSSLRFLAPAAAMQAPSGAQTYRDPQGRYSLTLPEGWKAEPQANTGALQLSSGPNWAMLLTGGGSVASDVNHQVTQQIQAQFKNFQLLNEGDVQINGHPSHGATATGINPKGERVSVLVLSINAGPGHFLTIISSSPNDQAKAVNATIVQMAQGIQF